jgi:hypothetical protein
MRHFLNDIEIAPRNLLDIGVVSDFTNRPDELSLNVDKLILPREALDIIQNHLQTQGVFEGIPYRVEMAQGVVLQYYVDLTENAIFRDFEIEVTIKRRIAKDSFFDQADGTSFELLAAKGVQFQFIDVPFLIVRDNLEESFVQLAISTYVMTKELIQAAKDLGTAITDFIQATVGSPLPPLGAIISLGIKVIIQAAYTAAVLIAVGELATQLIQVYFPNVRYLKACKVKELISKGCQYLGYQFQSNLLDNFSGATILPVPLTKEKVSIFDNLSNSLSGTAFTKGYPTAQDSTPTLGSLISAIETQCNAETKVVNGIVQLERRDYWQNLTPNAIIPALVLQAERQDEYTLNTSDIWKRYYIHYQYDLSDIHTMDFFDPTDAEFSTEPANVVNADLVSIKGLQDVNIPFALGVRKNNLNFIEKTAKVFFTLIDAVSTIFGSGTNFAGSIDDRIGMLQISQQFFTQTKFLYLIGNKQPLNYTSFVSASGLWNKFHFINQIQLYQFQVRSDVRTRISESDFVDLLNNNYATINGVRCEILRIEYIDEKSYATINYRQPDTYATGKVTTLTINE